MLALLGFKNLSNNNPYLIGSAFTIPKEKDTNEPALDPLPGPTRIPFSLAFLQ